VGNRATVGAAVGLVLVLVLVLAACQSGAPASAPSSPRVKTPTSPSAGPTLNRPVCATAHLRLGRGNLVSEATGQNSFMLTLKNTSSAPCHLDGYPHVELADETGKPIPFRYRNSGDQMITSLSPTVVTLAPGQTAYLLINKYRCDMGDKTPSRVVRVTPPGDATALRMAVGDRPDLAYCGPGDPGSVVDVSPVEATAKEVFAH
jgi:hypothetical protein